MRRMGVIPARRRTGFSGGRLLVLLAALAGLFAMHGMSDHGTMRHGTAQTHGAGAAGHSVAMAAEPAAEVLADLATTTTATNAVKVTTAAALTDALTSALESPVLGDVTESGDLPGAMGLCLAILAGALLLALRRAGLSSYPVFLVLASFTGDRVLPSRARAPDPPDLYALSIQRC